MTEEITIRRAVVGDQSILAALATFVQELHIREQPEVFKPVDLPMLERWFGDALADESSTIWIANSGETPAGYALVTERRRSDNVFTYSHRWYEVEQIGVHPAYTRRGISRTLFRHIDEAVAAKGVFNIELNTWAFNKVAHLSFERLGFVAKNLRLGRRISSSTGAGPHATNP